MQKVRQEKAVKVLEHIREDKPKVPIFLNYLPSVLYFCFSLRFENIIDAIVLIEK